MFWFRFVLALSGIALQCVGLVLAIQGVARTFHEVLPNSSLYAEVWTTASEWFTRLVLRRKQEPVTITGVASSHLGPITARGVLTTRPRTPADDAASDDWIAYLRAYVEILSNEVNGVRAHAEALVREAEHRVGVRVDQVHERIDAADDAIASVRAAVLGGVDGAGLRRAAVGLGLTLIGVAMTVPGVALSP